MKGVEMKMGDSGRARRGTSDEQMNELRNLFKEGLLALNATDRKKAAETFGEGLKLATQCDVDDALTVFKGALLLAKTGPKSAEESLPSTLGLTSSPMQEQALQLLGQILERRTGGARKAQDRYEKALEIPGATSKGLTCLFLGMLCNWHALTDKGTAYFTQAAGDQDLRIKSKAFYGLGKASFDREHYKDAVSLLKKSSQTPDKRLGGFVQRRLGDAYMKTTEADRLDRAAECYEKSERLFQEADESVPARDSFRKLCKVREKKAEISGVGSALSATVDPGDRIKETLYSHDNAIRKYALEFKKLPKKKEKETDEDKEKEKTLDDNTLLILKGWSSASPLIAQSERTAFGGQECRGGGYFIRLGGKGIALDPGYDFLRNFSEAGLHIGHLNAVIVTHDHPDHNADLRKLADLDFQYRHYCVDSPSDEDLDQPETATDASSVRVPKYFLDPDTYLHSQDLYLYKVEADDVTPLLTQKGNDVSLVSEGVDCVTFKAEHSRNSLKHPCGCTLTCKFKDKEVRLGYTSDTHYYEGLAGNFSGCEVIICHYSSARPIEFNSDHQNPEHLGYNGLKNLIASTDARMYVVSEFWGGIGDIRVDLAQKLMWDFRQKGVEKSVIPADIGLRVDLANLAVTCSICGHKVPYDQVSTVKPAVPYGRLRYHCPDCIA